MANRRVELVLLHNGGAELRDGDSVLWASDSDDDFKDEFQDEFLGEEDLADILDYLVDAEVISDEEADEADTIIEAMDGTTLPVDALLEDDDDDDDEEEDEIPAPDAEDDELEQ